MSKCHPAYIPLHFPLLAPTGQMGWNPDMQYVCQRHSSTSSSARNHVSLCDFLQFHLHTRSMSWESNHYFRSGFLLQEYIVEMWLAAEHARLRWLHNHQATLCTELYARVIDALHEGLHPSSVGHKVILPSSFTCSPCFMQKNLQSALTLLQVIRLLDLFITFTANPVWNKITDNLLPGQSASDQPDIVACVFHLKFNSLLDDIMKKNIFGKAIAYVYTVEYQKEVFLMSTSSFFWIVPATY